MAILLGNYVDSNITAPTRNPLDSGPSTGTIIKEGLTPIQDHLATEIDNRNKSLFIIESTKYAADRKAFEQELQQKVLAGEYTDVAAKDKLAQYDESLSAITTRNIPADYRRNFIDYRNQKNIEATSNIDSLYQKRVDDKFLVDSSITIEMLKKEPRIEAVPKLDALLADPRFPESKKIEIRQKFLSEYDTNALNSKIENSKEDDVALSDTLIQLRDDPEVSRNLTAEQVTAYEQRIKDQLDYNAKVREQERVRAENEARRLEAEQTKAQEDYLESAYSLVPLSNEANSAMSQINPNLVTDAKRIQDHLVEYSRLSAEERTQAKVQLSNQLTTGEFKTDAERDKAIRLLDTYNNIDSDMDTREKEDPVATYNYRNGTNLNSNDKGALTRALESSNSLIVPYSKEELENIKMQWTTPENKGVILASFVDNASKVGNPNNRNKALYDQISAIVPKGEIQTYMTAALLQKYPTPSFDGADSDNVTDLS